MHIDVAITIAARPDEVWEEVRHIDRHVEWMADAASIEFVTEQRAGVGASFDVLTVVGPLRTTDRMTITEWSDGQIMGVHHEGAVTGEGRFTLTEVGDGHTEFSWREDLRLPWYFGGPVGEVFAKPLLAAVWRRNLKGLKRRIESGHVASVPLVGEPGALVGTGRDTDVREWSPGTVVRVARDGRDLGPEMARMRYVADRGFPVPRVHGQPAPDRIVMDRISGPSMLDDLTHRPWRLGRHARRLAELHAALGDLAAPEEWTQAAPGDRCVHLDLHPENVLLTDDGAVVIDWANAGRGDPRLDVAMTWVVLKTAVVPGNIVIRGLVATFRDRFAKAFLRHSGGLPPTDLIVEACELKLLDRNLLAAERDHVFAVARAARANHLDEI